MRFNVIRFSNEAREAYLSVQPPRNGCDIDEVMFAILNICREANRERVFNRQNPIDWAYFQCGKYIKEQRIRWENTNSNLVTTINDNEHGDTYEKKHFQVSLDKFRQPKRISLHNHFNICDWNDLLDEQGIVFLRILEVIQNFNAHDFFLFDFDPEINTVNIPPVVMNTTLYGGIMQNNLNGTSNATNIQENNAPVITGNENNQVVDSPSTSVKRTNITIVISTVLALSLILAAFYFA